MSGESNSTLLDEERRQASHQEVKASIDDDVNAQIKRESAQFEPKGPAELAGVAHELKQKSAHEAIRIDRELAHGRTAARISQVVDFLFYIVYGLIGLQFTLRLLGARPGSGFVQFVAAVSSPLLSPFERIVGTPSAGGFQLQLSYLLALAVYILLHLAFNGMLRLIAFRKLTV
jgi:uncharacterized protein YggT (Ycf19 family)